MERELTVTNNRFTDLIPPLHHTREPLTVQSFLHYLLPPILCYYVTAVLVLLPETLHIRLAVLPLTLWMTFRGATRVDTIVMFNNDRLIYWNQGLVVCALACFFGHMIFIKRLISAHSDGNGHAGHRMVLPTEAFPARDGDYIASRSYSNSFEYHSTSHRCLRTHP